jgi:hypothetical protein
MALRTIVIGWWGPYTPEDVRLSDLENGLYFLAGRRTRERQDQIQYFGITEGPYRRRLNRWPLESAEGRRGTGGRIWIGSRTLLRRADRPDS